MSAQLQANAAERRERDRRTERRFRFRDDRSGFDRRRRYVILGTLRDNEWLLIAVLALVNVLSLLDGFLTYVEITTGIATEGNPLLASLFETHPLAAVGFKVFSVAMVSAIIWFGRRFKLLLAVSLFATAAFTAVIAYHLGSLIGLGLI